MDYSTRTQRRKKSLDEALINPIKSLMGIARTSTTKRHSTEDENNKKLDNFITAGRRRWSRGNDGDLFKKDEQKQRKFSIETEDFLKNKIEDPVLQKRINDYMNHQKQSSETKNKNDITDIVKNQDNKSATKRESSSSSDSALRKKIDKTVRNTATVKRTKQRRKSETEVMKIVHDESLETNLSVKRASSFKNDSAYKLAVQDTIKTDNEAVLNATKRKIHHKRTKSESEAHNIANSSTKSTSSLLDNPLLLDTTDLLYGKKSHKKKNLVTRSRSVSDTSESSSHGKHDGSLRNRIKNALTRSSSLKESKESLYADKDEPTKSERSLKERIKSAVLGRSTSFKENLEKEKNKLKCGSESEIYILTNREKTITVKRSSSLKECRLHRVDSENDILLTSQAKQGGTVKRSASTKEKSPSKRRVPNIMRRLSRQRGRKESENEDEIMSVIDDYNDSLSDSEVQNSPRISPSGSFDNTNDLMASILCKSNPSLPSEMSKKINGDSYSAKNYVSRSNSLQRKIEQSKQNSRSNSTSTNYNRSMSFGNVLDAQYALSPHKNGANLKRQLSLREVQSNYLNSCSASPLILRASQECLTSLVNNIEEPPIPRVVKKRKSLLKPFMRRKSVGKEDAQEQAKNVKFDNASLEKIVTSLLEDKMKDLKYDHTQSNYRCRRLSTSIETAVKERLNVEQEYKILALVYIGEKREHGIFFATQCCYEPSQDYFVTATYQCDNMFVCACVFVSLLPELHV